MVILLGEKDHFMSLDMILWNTTCAVYNVKIYEYKNKVAIISNELATFEISIWFSD